MTYAWIDLGDGRSVFRNVAEQPRGPVSHLPSPMVISDTMDLTEHIDGKFYDSKSRFRKVTKAHGCVEVGNDPARFRKPERKKPDRKAIKDAVKRADYLVRNGQIPKN